MDRPASTFYSVFGMHMLGGKSREEFFPPTVKLARNALAPDGSWATRPWSSWIGPAHSTSLVVLALNIPNQLLPIFQR